MFQLLYYLVHAIQPILVPLCFVAAWGFMALTAWSIWTSIRDSVQKTRQMHQIPCSGCQYFTKDYHLKCTVHPHRALSEEAIGCPDFE